MVCGDIMTMPGLPKIPSAEKIDLTEEPSAMSQVRSAAERAKIELSLLITTQIRVPNIVASNRSIASTTLRAPITRASVSLTGTATSQ